MSNNLHQVYALLLALANEDEKATAGKVSQAEPAAAGAEATIQAARPADSTTAPEPVQNVCVKTPGRGAVNGKHRR